MAVPKRRKTKSRRDQRRMHIYLKAPSLAPCPQCKEKKLMHKMCGDCGYYKGREVVDVLKKEKKASSLKKEKKGKEEGKNVSMESLSKKESK